MTGEPLTCAIIGHLVGDYLLQNDYAAKNKKLSSVTCAVHCLIWTTCVCLFAWWPWWAGLILFVEHFAQDRWNLIAWHMDKIGQRGFRTGPCAPWSAIVVDNVFHILAIWAVWMWLSSSVLIP